MKISWKNIENWRSWKIRFFWGGHFEFSKLAILIFFASYQWKTQPIYMRYHFFCTMDGFSRILEKRGGGLLCTRLYVLFYRPVREKYDLSKLKIFINKKFGKTFYFFTCILLDYVAHDITKEFWKNSHFENMTAGFLLRYQNSLRYEISLIWHRNINFLK